MNTFKQFNIEPKVSNFVGEKISIERLFNLQITVLDYRVEPSKHHKGTELLTLQIEKGGEKRIVFCGSKVLIDMIQRVPKNGFPFLTTIVGEKDYYEFT